MLSFITQIIISTYRATAFIRESVLMVTFGYVSHCRHQPTCSEFFLQEVKKRGWRGIISGGKRLLSCHS